MKAIWIFNYTGNKMGSGDWIIMALGSILVGVAVLATLIRRDFLGIAAGILLLIMAGLLNIAFCNQIPATDPGDSGTALAITAMVIAPGQLAVLLVIFRCASRRLNSTDLESARRLRG
jgi:NADH:ubiquinone oxidoreductase subunit K